MRSRFELRRATAAAVSPVRRALGIAALLGLAGVVAFAGPSAAAGSSAGAPSVTQIHNAVRAAQHSREVWATVNICAPTRASSNFGVRGQMPGLGFESTMYMTFRVYYRSPAGGTQPVSDTRRTILVARGSDRVYQSGMTFSFPTPATLLAKVTFVWMRNGRQLGQATRLTTAEHKPVDYGNPAGHSTAQCTLTTPAP